MFSCVNTRWSKCGRGHVQLSSDGMNHFTARFCLPVCISQESLICIFVKLTFAPVSTLKSGYLEAFRWAGRDRGLVIPLL